MKRIRLIHPQTRSPLLWRTASIAVSLVIAFTSVVRGQAQSLSANNISFQGALKGSDGKTLPDANYNLTFRFWDGPVPTGQPVSTNILVPSVPLNGGVASTAIPVDPAWFTGQIRYLSISINGGLELSPRVVITAVPYAMRTPFAEMLVAPGTIDPAIFVSTSDKLVVQKPIVTLGNITSGNSLGLSFFPFEADRSVGTFANWLGSGANALLRPMIGDGAYQGGFGMVAGSSIESPIVWFNDYEDRNCFQVRCMHTQKSALVTDGTPLFTVRVRNQGPMVGIGTENPEVQLDVRGNVRMEVCQITSDRNAKEHFETIDPRIILEKVSELPLTTWSYKRTQKVRHLGPVAQDFKAAFDLGDDDKHIATVDADGVALASIQALHTLLKEKDSEIRSLRNQLGQFRNAQDDLEKRLEALELRK